MLRFHDDPRGLRFGMFGRHEKVDMPENAAPGFVENEISQRLVLGDPSTLIPHAISRWGRYPANDNVANLTFSMARDNVNDFSAAHRSSLRFSELYQG